MYFVPVNFNYSDKLAHIKFVINCGYFVAQMCTREDTLANNLGAPYNDDIMSYNLLTTKLNTGLIICLITLII